MADSNLNPPAATSPLPFNQLRDTGLLWLINTSVFHPRGYALSIHINPETGIAQGWQLLGDGTQRWAWAEDVMADELDYRFQTVRRLMP